MHGYIRSLLSFFCVTICLAAAGQTYHEIARWDLHASGSFDYLLASSEDHRLYVAQGTQIVVVDTRNGSVIGTIAGLQHVHGVVLSADRKTGYISDGGANRIVIFDVPSLKISGAIPTGGENPDALLIEPTTGLLYTYNGKSRQGVAIDLKAQKVVGTFSVPGKPEFSQADGKGNVYVNIETTSQLLRVDAANRKVTAQWKLSGCEGPSGLAYDAAANRLFSVCDGEMAVTDAATGNQVALVSIGDGPDAVWFDAKRKLVFASNGETGTLSIVKQESPNRYTVQQTLKTVPGARTMALDPADGRAFVIAPMPSSRINGSSATDLSILVFGR